AVTFQTKGTFDYICALHDYMGMVGEVHVVD
ncbi:MAG: copper-binding protein, partial [Pseudarthrobacter sp.]|nr:copper-binding protein [Pseudarthrobacter sp.]